MTVPLQDPATGFQQRIQCPGQGCFRKGIEPDTEYVVAYCWKDVYGKLSSAYFTEPFRTKPLQKESPQSNKSDIALEFSDVTRTSLKFNFTYDPSNTAVIRFICIRNGEMDLYEAYGKVEVPEQTNIPSIVMTICIFRVWEQTK